MAANFWHDLVGVRAAWELDFWGKFRRGVEAADSNYLASIATYDDVLVTLLGDVATAYVGIRTLEKQIAIARANVVRQRQALAMHARDTRGAPRASLTFTRPKTCLERHRQQSRSSKFSWTEA